VLEKKQAPTKKSEPKQMEVSVDLGKSGAGFPGSSAWKRDDSDDGLDRDELDRSDWFRSGHNH
jgi:hypothetical protein